MLLVAAIRRGISMGDLENITIGMLIDYLQEYDEASNVNNEEEREATQEDIDNF